MKEEEFEKLEKDTIKMLHGKGTVGSGNKYDDGDAKSYTFLAECKYRSTKNIAIEVDHLKKVRAQAGRLARIGLLVNRNKDGITTISMSLEDFSALISADSK